MKYVEIIKEAVEAGRQSGKQETSGLVREILTKVETTLDSKIKEIVPTEIKKTVNGKIDKLSQDVSDMKEHLRQQDIVLKTIQDEQIRLKADTQPAVIAEQTIKNTGSFLIWAGSIGGVIAGIIFTIYQVIKKLNL